MLQTASRAAWLLVFLACLVAIGWAGETSSVSYVDDLGPPGVKDPPVWVKESGSERWVHAQIGMDLEPGDTVRVDEGATATLKVGGVAVVNLEPSSVFTIPETAAGGAGSTVELVEGSLWASVKKLAKGETFTVQTKNSVGGVKGTQFLVTQQKEGGDSDWSMLDGELQLYGRSADRGADRTLQKLVQGQTFGYRRGGVRKRRLPQVITGRRALGDLQTRFKRRFKMDLPDSRRLDGLFKRVPKSVQWRRAGLGGKSGAGKYGLFGSGKRGQLGSALQQEIKRRKARSGLFNWPSIRQPDTKPIRPDLDRGNAPVMPRSRPAVAPVRMKPNLR